MSHKPYRPMIPATCPLHPRVSLDTLFYTQGVRASKPIRNRSASLRLKFAQLYRTLRTTKQKTMPLAPPSGRSRATSHQSPATTLASARLKSSGLESLNLGR